MMSVIGIGTDIVECLRIAQMIERHGELFLGRVFTSLEIEYCSSRKTATQHYAGRWAAKEAVLKAMGTGWSPRCEWLPTRAVWLTNTEPPSPICWSSRARQLTRSPPLACAAWCHR